MGHALSAGQDVEDITFLYDIVAHLSAHQPGRFNLTLTSQAKQIVAAHRFSPHKAAF